MKIKSVHVRDYKRRPPLSFVWAPKSVHVHNHMRSAPKRR